LLDRGEIRGGKGRCCSGVAERGWVEC